MHLPQTLITVMHRTGQQQTETEPKPTKLWNPKWSGVESWWCPCSESARLIQLIFAKPAYRRKGRDGSMRYWKIEYSMSTARERSAPTARPTPTHVLLALLGWEFRPGLGLGGRECCTIECTLGCEWFLKNDSRAWSVWFHLVRQHNCMYRHNRAG